MVLSGGVPVLVNSLRYLVDDGNVVSSSESRHSSMPSSSSSSSLDGGAGSGSDTEAMRLRFPGDKNKGRKSTNDRSSSEKSSSRGKVIEDLSLFYALATLTNLCESPVYRTMIIGVGGFDVVGHLVDIVDSPSATSDDAVKQVRYLLPVVRLCASLSGLRIDGNYQTISGHCTGAKSQSCLQLLHPH